jgi:hypothetical protein
MMPVNITSLAAAFLSPQNASKSCTLHKFSKIEGMLVEKRFDIFTPACFLFLCTQMWGFVSTPASTIDFYVGLS